MELRAKPRVPGKAALWGGPYVELRLIKAAALAHLAQGVEGNPSTRAPLGRRPPFDRDELSVPDK